MRTTAAVLGLLGISSFILTSSLASWAAPRPGMGAKAGAEREPVRRGFPIVSGQVLLDTRGFLGQLPGGPGTGIGPFRASLRVYLAREHTLVQSVTADDRGKFELKLRPGDYRIVPDLMKNGSAIAPGDASGIVILGTYESAPALNLSLKGNDSESVTITYQMRMGS